MDSPSVGHSVLLAAITSLKQLLAPEFLKNVVVEAAGHTRSHLLVIVFSPLFKPVGLGGLAPVHYWKEVQRLLTFIYVEAARVSWEQDNVLLSVDVVLHSPTDTDVSRYHPLAWEFVYVLDQGDIIPLDDLPISTLTTTIFAPPFPSADDEQDEIYIPDNSLSLLPPTYPVAIVGGTFDHIHSGHKILVSIAAWIANEKVIVGVTDGALLVKKSNADIVESIDKRIEAVRSFGAFFDPSLIYEAVPISDVYGPTAWDPNIQALVVSHETQEGAAAVTSYRSTHALPPLEVFIIDVISSTDAKLNPEDPATLKEGKLSSTAIRQWIADKRALSTEKKE